MSGSIKYPDTSASITISSKDMELLTKHNIHKIGLVEGTHTYHASNAIPIIEKIKAIGLRDKVVVYWELCELANKMIFAFWEEEFKKKNI